MISFLFPWLQRAGIQMHTNDGRQTQTLTVTCFWDSYVCDMWFLSLWRWTYTLPSASVAAFHLRRWAPSYTAHVTQLLLEELYNLYVHSGWAQGRANNTVDLSSCVIVNITKLLVNIWLFFFLTTQHIWKIKLWRKDSKDNVSALCLTY